MVGHSPVGQAALEAGVSAEMRKFRKCIQKLDARRVKILAALEEEGQREAGDYLALPACPPAAARCGKCAGCVT